MDKRNIEAIYPLSPMQQGMVFHSLYAGDSGVYIEQLTGTLEGAVNVPAFQQAWQCVVQRHPILRTSFVWKKLDRILQVVHKQVSLPFEVLDWRHLNQAEQQLELERLIRTNQQTGFNLNEPPLLRITLIRLGENRHQFLWCHHHALLDGWSLPLVMKEVFVYYQALARGKDIRLPAVRPYRDYINWLQQQSIAEAEQYWRNALAGFYAPTPLVVDQISKAQPKPDKNYDETKRYLSESLTAELQSLARKHQITLNNLLQGAWAILLSRYSGQSDVVFGTTVSGRPAELPGVESMVGLFINTLPLRVVVSDQAGLIPWLKQLHAQQIEMRQFEFAPLVEIQRWSELPKGTPLFESILVFENYPIDSALLMGDSDIEISNVHGIEQTNYPITLVGAPGKQMYLLICYDTHRLSRLVVERMLDHLTTLLEGFVANPEQSLGELNLLSSAERQQILLDWNQTAAPFPQSRCLHELVEEQVAKSPDAIAVIFKNEKMSYLELNRRANQLAHFLQQRGIGPGMRVGISMERSIEMIVAVLATIKAGGAYVPIDPNYPKDRIMFMLHDAQLSILLTQQPLLDRFELDQIEAICVDTQWEQLAKLNDQNLGTTVNPENLAYIIYTSGSTGRPKGTMLEHRGVINFVVEFARLLNLSPQSRMLQFASLSFDASVAEIFPCLIIGATLVIAQQHEVMSAIELKRLMQLQAVNAVCLPPSMLNLLDPADLPELSTVISAGEACHAPIVENWAIGRTFVNAYGPTETSVGASFYRVDPLLLSEDSVPIGRPFQNKQFYVLDERLRPVPIGVPGELYIGGVGLSRGYLNRPDLTAERFIADPFGSKPGQRIYKTGDLVRYRPDGNLEYLGRVDHQIKLRGFRIEMEEIEAVIHQFPGIKAAAVAVHEDQNGEKSLSAYLVPDSSRAEGFSVAELQAFLKTKLPDYMVPARFMMLDHLPLTPNGKIDRAALPAPDHSAFLTAARYVPPRTATEQLLATIMAHILQVDRVGLNDNFFQLGGHSLLGVRLQSRIRDAFQIELPLRQIFDSATLSELASAIDAIRAAGPISEMPAIEPMPRDQEIPLSFAQQRLWFLDQLQPNSPFYNIPIALRAIGNLNISALKQSLQQVIQRHETLRTSFKVSKGKPYQIISDQAEIKIEIIDLTQMNKGDQELRVQQLATEEAIRPFDLSSGPLLRVSIIRLQPEQHVILVTMHHIISDGWSMAIFIKEVAACYQAVCQDQAISLPNLPIQYADFANWQRRWLTGSVLEQQLDYWKQQLAGLPPMLELPTDKPRPAIQSANGAALTRKLSLDLLKSAKNFSGQENVTLFMTLLAAFKTLLFRYTGQGDIAVGIPHASRNRSEIEGLIGFFVNTLVLRTQLGDAPSFKELVRRVREVTLAAYAHQDLPFEMLVEAIQPQRDLSHTPLFQVMFVMQNMPLEPLELPGLTFEPIQIETRTAKFDLSLIASEASDGLEVIVEYNTDLFYPATIQRIMEHFERVLHLALSHPDQSISRLPLLSEAEHQQILIDWNRTRMPFPDGLAMHQWFEQVSATHSDRIAVRYKDQQLSYAELNRRANQLANYLIAQGVHVEDLIGICMTRSPEMIIAVMGSLKAGAAFIPLDPAYPKERLAYMISDSNATMVLTQQALASELEPIGPRLVCLDTEWENIFRYPTSTPNIEMDAENLAYVIYTSGSTGKPKGTMIQHRGWCNLGRVQQMLFGIGPDSRILQFSALSFDASVWEMVMALGSGGTLVLTDQESLLTGQSLLHVLQHEQITTVTLPPSVLAVIPQTDLPELRTLITAGEACTKDLVDRWANGRQMFNAYGPTETTVCASAYSIDAQEDRNPAIGRPIANFELYILDSNLVPVPIGVPGELCVGGIGLARGYLRRPDLTAEKFIPNPFSSEPGARLYRTGDLVKYRPDGNIEFLGRIDQQVKLRGFRIELGEIETLIASHPGVRDAAVVVREDPSGGRRLVAYFTVAPESQMDLADLRRFLRSHLPEYMVPASLMQLERFPLTPSGKVDRKALPAPDFSRATLENPYIAPRNDIEAKLANICARLLNIQQVGISDNFFDLGGHSLLATQFIAHVEDEFQVELPLRAIFEEHTIAGLAEKIATLPPASFSATTVKMEAEQRGEQKLADLISELVTLSDEEAKQLLASEMISDQ
ncbi:MAG: amino acid adenylation domain-containing protein [candidate division KSB1 bacterium]|nr:amino acid adenylation domain-containing protein [candidate division KSB1 bacterium]